MYLADGLLDADLDWTLHLDEPEVGILLLGERSRIEALGGKREIISKTRRGYREDTGHLS